MNKIGIFFRLSAYGGVQTCVISLIRGLNKIGIVPDFLTDAPVNQKIINEFDLKLNQVRIKYSISINLAKKIAPIFQGSMEMVHFFKTSWLEEKYDFLYIFTPKVIVNTKVPHLYYLSMSTRSPGFSGRNFLPRLKFLVYDYFYKYFVPVYELHGTVDNYVINSKYTADLFYKTYGKEVKVIYPSNLLSAPTRIDYSKKNTVLFLSRIVSPKRPEMFIHLAEKYRKETFVMAGVVEDETYINSLRKLISDKGITNVQIIANAPFQEILNQLIKAKIYVFPAINEHFGITTVEAMIYGAIPFVHNSGGQKEIVPWENLRFEDEEFYEKFSHLINEDKKSSDEIKQKVMNHVQNFSEQIYIDKMLQYIT